MEPPTETTAKKSYSTKEYRQMYYLAHKDDEEFLEKSRKYRMESYYRNQEKEKERSLARYYKKKAERLAQQQAMEASVPK